MVSGILNMMVEGADGSWSFVVQGPSSFFPCWSVELCNIVAIAFNKKFNMLQLTGDIMFQISPRLPSAHSSNIAAIIVPSSRIVLLDSQSSFYCFFLGSFVPAVIRCDWARS